MKYYLHDSNAFNDEKITELFMQFGYEGLGLFYTVLEKIAGQEKPVKTDVLKSQLNVGKRLEKCWLFMESLGIISSNNGETYSNFFEKSIQTKRLSYHSPKEWNILRANVFIRDNFSCVYCGSAYNIECDHVMPFAKGGEDTMDNLATSCKKCNRTKGSKPVNIFLESLNRPI